MMFSNRTIIISLVFIFVIIGTVLVFVPININQGDTSSTTSTGNTKQTLTVTNTTTFIFTTTSVSSSTVTTTLPPNIVTVTSTTTTIIQPQEVRYILGDNITTTYTVNLTTTRTVTTNITLTTTKDWHISGAKISQPSLVESITFTFTNYDRLLQVGSYISFSPNYETVVRAVMNENGIINATNNIITGNVEIGDKYYQYTIFNYNDPVTNDLKYVIIATYYYPDFLRTYYIFYETSSESTLDQMKAYLGTFKIGI